MASKFTITAELNLQTKNLNQVIGNLKQQFQGANLNVNIKDLAQAQSKVNNLTKAAQTSQKSFNSLGNSVATAAKRFSAITLATGTLVGFTRAVKNAVSEAIEFEREVIKISQATGQTVEQLRGLTNEITSVATNFGVSSKELILAARSLTQAGFAADKVAGSLKLLAQTELAATFDSIQNTTEGVIAVLNQFGQEAQRTGTEVQFLEKSLSAINQVSKDFAVESSDLVTAIRTTGAAFESSGGSLNELLALFTSVRATTRESAESIATGFRTIFTRTQRLDTINNLRALGVELQTVEGKFVGPMEAVKRLSLALNSIDPKDFRFNMIVEELGGFRQVSKVIPLIQQFATTQKALNVAQGASGSLAKDAATAQQSLSVQIAKTREKFLAFIRDMTNSSSFQGTVKTLLNMADAFLRVADTIKPLIPLIATFASFKIGTSLVSGFTSSFGGAGTKKKAQGGPIHKFASGGLVPGSGNGDTVPAMLTPGEFVIKKSSVKSLGADNLARANKYGLGTGSSGVKANNNSKKEQLVPSGGIHFTHLDKLGYSGKYRNKEVLQLYSNVGLDLPANWNLDWSNHSPNNKGVFARSLASYIKNNNVFSTLLSNKNKLWKFAGGKKSQAYQSLDMHKKDIQSHMANSMSKTGFYDTDPDVIRADVAGKLFESLNLYGGTGLSRAFKKVSAVRYSGEEQNANARMATTRAFRKNLSKKGAKYGDIAERFAIGGKVGDLSSAAGYTFPQEGTYTFNKASGQSLFKKNKKGQFRKFTPDDILDYNRTDEAVDVNALYDEAAKKKSAAYKRYAQAVEKNNSKERGYGFEDVLVEKKNLKKSIAENARLDGMIGDAVVEAKSESKQLNQKRLEEKLIGGALSRSRKESFEQALGSKIDKMKLTEDSDVINLGSVKVFQDTTNGLGRAVQSRASGVGLTDAQIAKQSKQELEAAQRTRIVKLLSTGGLMGFKIPNTNLGPVAKSGRIANDLISLLMKSNTSGDLYPSIAKMNDPALLGLLKKVMGKSVGGLIHFASGGAASGTDTVPAMLTPGEFVINKKSAQAIGYSGLTRMNQVGKFAKGGVVGASRFATGGNIEARQESIDKYRNIFDDAMSQSVKLSTSFVLVSSTIASTVAQMLGLNDATANAVSAFTTTFAAIHTIGDQFLSIGKSIITESQAKKIALQYEKLNNTVKQANSKIISSNTNAFKQNTVSVNKSAMTNNVMASKISSVNIKGKSNASNAGSNATSILANYNNKIQKIQVDAFDKEVDKKAKQFAAMMDILDGALTGFSLAMATSSAAVQYYSTKTKEAADSLEKVVSALKENSTVVTQSTLTAATEKTFQAAGYASILDKKLNEGTGLAAQAAASTVGSGIGGVIGGQLGGDTGRMVGAQLGGIIAGQAATFALMKKADEEYAGKVKELTSLSTNYSKALFTSIKTVQDFNKFMQDIDKKSTEQIGEKGFEIAQKYVESVNALTQAQNSAISIFGSLQKTPDVLKNSFETLRISMTELNKAVDATIGVLTQRAAKDIENSVATGGNPQKIQEDALKRFQRINKPTSDAATEMAYRSQINEELKRRARQELIGRGESYTEADVNELAEKKRTGLEGKNLENLLNDVKNRKTNLDDTMFRKSLKEMELQSLRNARAALIEKQARDAVVGSLMEELALKIGLENFNMSLLKVSKTIDAVDAAFSGTVSGMKSSIPDIKVLDLLKPSANNINDFNAALNKISGVGDIGRKLATNLNVAREASLKFKVALENVGDIGANFNVDKFVESIVGGENVGGAVGIAMKKMLEEAIKPTEGEAAASRSINTTEGRQKLIEQFESFYKNLTEKGKEILKSLGEAEQQQRVILDKMNESRQKQLDLQLEDVDSFERYVSAVASARGKGLTLTEKNALRNEKQVRMVGGNAGNIDAIGAQLLNNRRASLNSTDPFAQARFADSANKAEQALKSLANQSDRTKDTLEEIEKIKGQRQAISNAVEEYTFATPEKRQEMQANYGEVQKLAQSGGNIEAVNPESRAAVQSILDQFKDIPMFNGMTGAQLKAKTKANTARQMGAGEEVAQMIEKDTSTPEEKLIGELRRIYEQEAKAKSYLFEQENTRQEALIGALNETTSAVNRLADEIAQEFAAQQNNAGLGQNAGGGKKKTLEELDNQITMVNNSLFWLTLSITKQTADLDAAMKKFKDNLVTPELTPLQQVIEKLMNIFGDLGISAKALGLSFRTAALFLDPAEWKGNGPKKKELMKDIAAFEADKEKIQKEKEAAAAAAAKAAADAAAAAQQQAAAAGAGGNGQGQNKASGGVIHRAVGGNIKGHPGKPRGTDTVPAWLSEGEFVVNARDTKKHRSALEAINSGNGDTIYSSHGGIAYLADGGMPADPGPRIIAAGMTREEIFRKFGKRYFPTAANLREFSPSDIAIISETLKQITSDKISGAVNAARNKVDIQNGIGITDYIPSLSDFQKGFVAARSGGLGTSDDILEQIRSYGVGLGDSTRWIADIPAFIADTTARQFGFTGNYGDQLVDGAIKFAFGSSPQNKSAYIFGKSVGYGLQGTAGAKGLAEGGKGFLFEAGTSAISDTLREGNYDKVANIFELGLMGNNVRHLFKNIQNIRHIQKINKEGQLLNIVPEDIQNILETSSKTYTGNTELIADMNRSILNKGFGKDIRYVNEDLLDKLGQQHNLVYMLRNQGHPAYLKDLENIKNTDPELYDIIKFQTGYGEYLERPVVKRAKFDKEAADEQNAYGFSDLYGSVIRDKNLKGRGIIEHELTHDVISGLIGQIVIKKENYFGAKKYANDKMRDFITSDIDAQKMLEHLTTLKRSGKVSYDKKDILGSTMYSDSIDGGEFGRLQEFFTSIAELRGKSYSRKSVNPFFPTISKSENPLDDIYKFIDETMGEKSLNFIKSLARDVDINFIDHTPGKSLTKTGKKPPPLKNEENALYRANGGSIFQPRGTDVIPAMLSKGEFVMQKSAVDKHGVGMMKHLNAGGSVSYLDEGGLAWKGWAGEESNDSEHAKVYAELMAAGEHTIAALLDLPGSKWTIERAKKYLAVSKSEKRYAAGLKNLGKKPIPSTYPKSDIHYYNPGVGGFNSQGPLPGNNNGGGVMPMGGGMGFMGNMGGMRGLNNLPAIFDKVEKLFSQLENSMSGFSGSLTLGEKTIEPFIDQFGRMNFGSESTTITGPGKQGGCCSGIDTLATVLEADNNRFIQTIEQVMKMGGVDTGYYAQGGSVFQPRGTDTVPAMLSKGEFVIRKSAVDKIGVQNLHAINRAGGGTVKHERTAGGIPTINNRFVSSSPTPDAASNYGIGLSAPGGNGTWNVNDKGLGGYGGFGKYDPNFYQNAVYGPSNPYNTYGGLPVGTVLPSVIQYAGNYQSPMQLYDQSLGQQHRDLMAQTNEANSAAYARMNNAYQNNMGYARGQANNRQRGSSWRRAGRSRARKNAGFATGGLISYLAKGGKPNGYNNDFSSIADYLPIGGAGMGWGGLPVGTVLPSAIAYDGNYQSPMQLYDQSLGAQHRAIQAEANSSTAAAYARMNNAYQNNMGYARNQGKGYNRGYRQRTNRRNALRQRRVGRNAGGGFGALGRLFGFASGGLVSYLASGGRTYGGLSNTYAKKVDDTTSTSAFGPNMNPVSSSSKNYGFGIGIGPLGGSGLNWDKPDYEQMSKNINMFNNPYNTYGGLPVGTVLPSVIQYAGNYQSPMQLYDQSLGQQHRDLMAETNAANSAAYARMNNAYQNNMGYARNQARGYGGGYGARTNRRNMLRQRMAGRNAGGGWGAVGRFFGLANGGLVSYLAKGGDPISGMNGVGGYGNIASMIPNYPKNAKDGDPYMAGNNWFNMMNPYNTYGGLPVGTVLPSVIAYDGNYQSPMQLYDQSLGQQHRDIMAQTYMANSSAYARMNNAYRNNMGYASNQAGRRQRGGSWRRAGRARAMGRARGHADGGMISFFANGGSLQDTVPAMLTPGEYVMSKEAVSNHGVGFMEHLNKGGGIKGFNTGGVVGATEYKAGGGAVAGGMGAGSTTVNLNVDLASISSAISSSVQRAFSAVGSIINMDALNNLASTFSNLVDRLGSVAGSLSGMQMSHQVTIDGSVNIGGLNSKYIAEAIKTEVSDFVTNEVIRILNSRSNEAKF